MDKENITADTLAKYIDVRQLKEDDPMLKILMDVFIENWMRERK